MKNIVIRLAAPAALILLTAATASPAKPDQASSKVLVCHVGDAEEGHVISISQSALPAHEAHGDYTVEDMTPGSTCPAEAPASSN